ncbi:tetraacyldisaccharide 4'-kinase [Azohydromonas caseinilytica]|uniref:Tetraacyldisaccharide 4'-kinase n=1 Tax=Azohydromonas caseinilytica TaxID=2728836 RepID=A0A848F8D4_9BURK|nr:tetraacyldisaccharide 4'-kinase [Azohydromonas caseinilytica]NML15468.1 tetraacyldisaccharide 4'-kinase [Azohydromonas caseinilytica]
MTRAEATPGGTTSRLGDWLQRQWWQPRPSPAARLLGPLSLLYETLAERQRRNTTPQSPGLPVVVVGNLIVGGAGKTPTVIALAQALRALGWTPGVISRGHGRAAAGVAEVRRDSRAREVGDEPLLIHLRSGAPVVVGRDRLAAAQALRVAHPDVNLLLADDGLQHWRLARDAQVIVFDDRGAGNGFTLPAGPMRQRLPDSVPPRSLVLYNAATPSTPLPGWCAQRRLAGAVELGDWWAGRPPSPDALQALRDRRVVAVAGIGAPQRFFAMLQAQGLSLTPCPVPDHHDYATLPWPPGSADVVLTEKDAIKLEPGRCAGTRVWVVALDFALPDDFVAALARLLPSPPHEP